MLMQNLLPVASLYVLKMLVDTLGTTLLAGTSVRLASLLVLLFGGLFLLSKVAEALGRVNADVMSQKVADAISNLIQRQSARLDMAYYDTPAYYDTLHRAQQEGSSRPIQIVNSTVSLFGALAAIIGVATLIAVEEPVALALLVVAALPESLVRFAKARKIYLFRRNSTSTVRQTAYYSSLLSGKASAAELRAYASSSLFRQRFVAVRRQLVARLTAISRRLGFYDMVCALFETVAMLLAMWLMLRHTFAGSITVGAFVMLFEAFRRGLVSLHTAVGSVASLYDSRLFLGNLFEFLELEPSIDESDATAAVPSEVRNIEFRDVTFSYPGMARNAVEHFNFEARRGQVSRLQGRNGMGKSTIVKLLLRFYQPDSGIITVNGIDLSTMPAAEWRLHVGTVFQDFVRYNCTVAENIALGSSDIPVDYDRVRLAACQAGADVFIERLPKGYDTQLGRMFEGGVELSTGQWQALAWARALYRDPQVLLLDEPAAWLDTQGRELFNKTIESLKDSKIIILITHTQ